MKNLYQHFVLYKRKRLLPKSFPLKSAILLLGLLLTFSLSAQQTATVSGIVVDETGEPIIGAGITVVNQKGGTLSDIDGKFSLSAAPNATLSISYIGFVTQTIAIKNRTSITVTLLENVKSLEEVVVIGYGTMKRKDLTGAVASLKNEDITIAPTTNVMEALQGKIAGMDITKTSGQIGQDVSIVLRGNRSIYGSNEPLFIIDGMPGKYSQINPSDIETIDVLKDASSTAIYGSAGANGVVMITTKRAKEGKTTVNFDAYYGFSGSPKYFHGMRGDEWTAYQREAYKYKNGQYPADMSAILTDAQQLADYNAGKWIDWVDEAAGNTATNQKYNLSVMGGTAKTKIFASMTYDKQEGLQSNEKQDRYALRLNIDQEISSWAKAGVTSNLTYTKRDSGSRNTLTKSLTAFPLGDVYDQDGNLNHMYSTNEYTPLGDFIKNQYVNNTRSTYVNANAYLEIKPMKDLSFRTVISATLGHDRIGQYIGAKAGSNRPQYGGTPHAEVKNSDVYGYMWDNILSYNKTFLSDHSISATLVSSWDQSVNESFLAATSGQNLDSWSFYRMVAGNPQYIESNYARKNRMSYAARLNYSYKGKYLFALSSRWDGVSWLAEGNKWDVFPAGSFAWRISEESFMESTRSWLDNLKLRIGYGITGNSGGVEPYATTSNAKTTTTGGATIDGKNASLTQYAGFYPNPNLSWEKSYNTNIGIDMSLFNSKVDLSLDWFQTKTKDVLFKRTMPITSGVAAWGKPIERWENIAETKNNGIELTLNTRNINTKDFSWNSTLTFTWSKEKITSLPSGDLIAEQLFAGHSIKSLYGYKYKGIWGTDTPNETLTAYGVKPGWVMIETVPQGDDNGVHKYSENDRQILGHTNPDYIIGLNNSITYRDFDFSVFAMARYGQTIVSDLLGRYEARGPLGNNQIAGVNYWTEDNQSAYYPIPGSGEEQKVMPALRYRDGSFIKIKNITLGYTLPRQISSVAKMERCRFYFTAYNPYLFVKDSQLKGTDPETNGSDTFPLYKQFVFGVNVTF